MLAKVNHRFTPCANDLNVQAQGIGDVFYQRQYKGVPAQHGTRIERITDRLDANREAKDMDLPGFEFHARKGDRKGEFAVSVSGNWRITFEFDGQNAVNVNLEDYH